MHPIKNLVRMMTDNTRALDFSLFPVKTKKALKAILQREQMNA